ncbi:MAG: efflux RND transporter periplasmic adaptor subunit [Desulfobulbaceae bacterium]|nr:efflux RND transporter periplasmic adaptor subunit [Desulfobulbaceae bacterium]
MKIPILLITVLLLAVAGCRNEHPEKKYSEERLPPVKVEAVTVAAEEALLQNEVVGTVQPVDRAEIAAKVTGTIEQIPVVLGSRVQQGDLLVKINAGEISARVNQARTLLDQARRNLEREKKLLEKNAATAENVKSLEEAFQFARAAHEEAEVMFGYTVITAPFAGQITRKNVNPGDLATPGLPLLELEDDRKLQVVTAVPEGLVLQLSPGDTLRVSIPAAGLAVQGRVAEIAPAADPLSRTAAVKLDIEVDPRLRSGQFARVALPGTGKDAIFVPASAVLVFGQMDTVFVIRDDTARLRLVRTGALMNGVIEILAGLEPGEKVVVRNNAQLLDGQPVIIEQ